MTRLYYPHIGGVENHLEKISRILTKRGYEITILTTKHDINLEDTEKNKGTVIHRFKQPDIKYIGLLYTWFWLLKNRDLIKHSDIVHIHDVFIWYWPFKLIYPHKKVFITNHGQWGKCPISIVDKIQKKIGVRLANGVISIGKYIDKNYGITSDIISYGAVTAPPDTESKKENLILYVGRLDKITGLPIFIDMLHKYHATVRGSNVKVIFCGDGELRNECSKYGKVLGWSDPTNYYRKARYVFASGYLTILEALANKCLVFAAYTNPLQKDYYSLTPFKKYIYFSENSDDLYSKFTEICRNLTKANKLIDKGRKWSEEQTWYKLTEKYLQLWKIK